MARPTTPAPVIQMKFIHRVLGVKYQDTDVIYLNVKFILSVSIFWLLGPGVANGLKVSMHDHNAAMVKAKEVSAFIGLIFGLI